MSEENQVQVHWHEHAVSREERQERNGHTGCVVWFTGLSACGKSTVANLVDHKLHSAGIHSFVLDGDNIRHGLNAGPGMLKEQHGESNLPSVSAWVFPPRTARRTSAASAPWPSCFATRAWLPSLRSSAPIGRTATASAPRWPPAISLKFLWMPPSKYARPAIPRDSTRRPGPASSRVLRASTTPTRPPMQPEMVLDAADHSADALADEVIAHLKKSGRIR